MRQLLTPEKFIAAFLNTHAPSSPSEYLSAVGGTGTLKAHKDKVTRDELFVMQDSEPQFTIRDVTRNMQVSTRNGNECKADQKPTDISDAERFQLEVDAAGKVSAGGVGP
jgi:fascin 1/2